MGRNKLGIWDYRCTLLYIKQITSKDVLYSTGNYIQYLVITYNGKEYKKTQIYTYMKTERKSQSLSCVQLCDPMNCSLPGSSVHDNFPGKNTGVGCHFLLQEIFLTQGSNPGLQSWQVDSLPLSHQGFPIYQQQTFKK